MKTIKLIISDVDGVLTDGLIRLMPDGGEIKAFSCKDAPAIKLAKKAGLKVVFITARIGPSAQKRAQELGVDLLSKNEFSASIADFYKAMARRYEVPEDAILYVGDDLGDLPFFLAAPFAAAPHDAAPDVLAEADFVAKVNGGRGVIAEVIREVLV